MVPGSLLRRSASAAASEVPGSPGPPALPGEPLACTHSAVGSLARAARWSQARDPRRQAAPSRARHLRALALEGDAMRAAGAAGEDDGLGFARHEEAHAYFARALHTFG